MNGMLLSMTDGYGGYSLVPTNMATFAAPTAIVYDGSAYLYVLDNYWFDSAYGTWVIRRVSVANGEERGGRE